MNALFYIYINEFDDTKFLYVMQNHRNVFQNADNIKTVITFKSSLLIKYLRGAWRLQPPNTWATLIITAAPPALMQRCRPFTFSTSIQSQRSPSCLLHSWVTKRPAKTLLILLDPSFQMFACLFVFPRASTKWMMQWPLQREDILPEEFGIRTVLDNISRSEGEDGGRIMWMELKRRKTSIRYISCCRSGTCGMTATMPHQQRPHDKKVSEALMRISQLSCAARGEDGPGRTAHPSLL